MSISNRLKKLETGNGDGVDCDEPSWYSKENGVKKPKKPILDVCDVCRKPTRKELIAINWVTNLKEN